jgi:hypothetical protein
MPVAALKTIAASTAAQALPEKVLTDMIQL